MSKPIHAPSQASLSHDLEHTRARLTYYVQQKERAPGSKMLNKWIAIYSDRVEELEKTIKREQARGLRIQLAAQQIAKAAVASPPSAPAKSASSRRARG